MAIVYGILFTIIAGLLITVGSLFVFLNRKNEIFVYFIMSLSIGILLPLVFLQLIPEIMIKYNETNIENPLLFLFFFLLIGIIFLKVSDFFLPLTKIGKEKTLIGVVYLALIAMFLNDFIEGMAIMSTTLISFDLGLNLTLGVGINNITMGMFLAALLFARTKDVKKTALLIFIASIAPLLGGLFVLFNPIYFQDPLILASLLSLVSGMILYLVFFELIPQFKKGEILINAVGLLIGFFIILAFVM